MADYQFLNVSSAAVVGAEDVHHLGGKHWQAFALFTTSDAAGFQTTWLRIDEGHRATVFLDANIASATKTGNDIDVMLLRSTVGAATEVAAEVIQYGANLTEAADMIEDVPPGWYQVEVAVKADSQTARLGVQLA